MNFQETNLKTQDTTLRILSREHQYLLEDRE